VLPVTIESSVTPTPTATTTPTKTPVPPTATPTLTPTKVPTSSTAAIRDGIVTGGGTLKDGERTAALILALSCDDDRKPARLELLWRTPSERDPREDRRADWDWDDRQWDGRDWSTRDWKDRDWDDHNWDDRDWRNWGRGRSENRSGRDSDERRGGWNRFHLTDVTSAQCSNDPSIVGLRGVNFDTQRGSGRGRLADGSAATVEWTLVDAGLLGQRDRATLKVRDDRGRTIFESSGALSTGRIEAQAR
jgi:hypothetical protein